MYAKTVAVHSNYFYHISHTQWHFEFSLLKKCSCITLNILNQNFLLVTQNEVCPLLAWQLIGWCNSCHWCKRLEKHSNSVINCVCHLGIRINPKRKFYISLKCYGYIQNLNSLKFSIKSSSVENHNFYLISTCHSY